MQIQQWLFLAILASAGALLLTERLRNDVVALLIVLALYLSGILKSDEALSGFASEPAIVVAAMFVLGAGIHQTGLDEIIVGRLTTLAGRSYPRLMAALMPLAALLAAFTNDMTTTTLMLPVTLNLARQRRIPASKVLMPLSFAASLGTTITLIGAPALLIASSILQSSGRPPLGLFSPAPLGLAISLVGLLYMLTVGRHLLPVREEKEDPSTRFRLDDYFTEVTIPPDSPLLGKTLRDLETNGWHNLRVTRWLRNGRSLRPPFAERQLSAGDVLLVRTTPEEIVNLRQEQGIALLPVGEYGRGLANDSGPVDDVVDQLVQVVVAPGSDLVGRPLRSIDFRERYGVLMVGLWRREGFLDQELAKTKLRVGDILVLQGEEDALDRVAQDAAFLVMLPFQGEGRFRRKAPLAGAIMLLTLLAAASNLVTLAMAALAGAVAMVVLRCLTLRQAYRSIDYRIYLFIAGAIPLGLAMNKTGLAALIAGGLQPVMGGWNQTLILFTLFAAVGVVTQFMDDAAATAIFAPVALALAQGLHQRPEAYVMTVAIGAVAALLTPMGHNGNLLVYGPGRYQFSDFVKVGAPLTLLVGLVVALLAPLLWPH